MRGIYRSAGHGLTLGLAALTLTGCGSGVAAGCGELTVDAAWVRGAPPGAEVMAAYFTLSNPGDRAVTINALESAQFERAGMHESFVNDSGQASMQPLERITVDAGETVAFEPGGRHVMLFSPAQAYQAEDQVELVLVCGTQNAALPVAAVVRAQPPTGGGMKNHAHMNHGSG